MTTTATATQPERLIFLKLEREPTFAPEVLKFVDELVLERANEGRIVQKLSSDDMITVLSWEGPQNV